MRSAMLGRSMFSSIVLLALFAGYGPFEMASVSPLALVAIAGVIAIPVLLLRRTRSSHHQRYENEGIR